MSKRKQQVWKVNETFQRHSAKISDSFYLRVETNVLTRAK